jgi:acyl carrier protein
MLDKSYEVAIEWSAAGPGCFDAVFRPSQGTEAVGAIADITVTDKAQADVDVSAYANRPALRGVSGANRLPDLRQHLRSTLPEYMIPAAFVPLEALPLTPNGKLDRQALPAPDGARRETTAQFNPPATEVERKLAAIFQELLGVNEIGIDDNFFELGANSLMMVRVVEKIRAELGLQMSVVRVFRYPTLSSLAGAIANSGTSRGSTAAPPEHNRGQLRRDMMQRRREIRSGSKTNRN